MAPGVVPGARVSATHQPRRLEPTSLRIEEEDDDEDDDDEEEEEGEEEEEDDDGVLYQWGVPIPVGHSQWMCPISFVPNALRHSHYPNGIACEVQLPQRGELPHALWQGHHLVPSRSNSSSLVSCPMLSGKVVS